MGEREAVEEEGGEVEGGWRGWRERRVKRKQEEATGRRRGKRR